MSVLGRLRAAWIYNRFNLILLLFAMLLLLFLLLKETL